MGVNIKELTFERAFDTEVLSSFDCGVRSIDQLIHKKKNGLKDFILDSNYESFYVFHGCHLVAIFLISGQVLTTENGNYDAVEIDFLAVRKEYQRNKIGRKIIETIERYASENESHFLKVGAYADKKYSAEKFYKNCGFEQISERQGNIIPMFKAI